MSSNMGLCHRNEAVFIYPGDEPQEKGTKCNGTDGVDEFDTPKVHVILRILIDQLLIVN